MREWGLMQKKGLFLKIFSCKRRYREDKREV